MLQLLKQAVSVPKEKVNEKLAERERKEKRAGQHYLCALLLSPLAGE